MSRSSWFQRIVVCLFIACLATPLALARKGVTVKALPDEGFPPLDEAHLTLNEVDFAPGAPALLLLDAEQQRWVERRIDGASFTRVDKYLRVKILDPSAIERWGTREWEFSAGWRVTSVEARTIQPDGTIIDAGDGVRIERSTYETGEVNEESAFAFTKVFVSFPEVKAGSILDLHLSRRYLEGSSTFHFVLQRDVPILEKQIIYFPNPVYRSVTTPTQKMVEGEGNAVEIKNVWGNGFGWTFNNLAPLRDEPNRPADLDVSKVIFAIPALSGIVDVSDWSEYEDLENDFWIKWKKKSRREAKALAKKLTAKAKSGRDKAVLINAALMERIDVTHNYSFPVFESADEVLLRGMGSTADAAGLFSAMLDGLKIENELVLVRRRGDGRLPEFPFHRFWNDAVVRMKTDEGPLWVVPASTIPVGSLRWDHYGVKSIVLNNKIDGLEQISELAPEDFRVSRDVSLDVDAEGTVTGRASIQYLGIAAHRERDFLRPLTSEEVRNRYQSLLQEVAPSAAVQKLDYANMDRYDEPLLVTLEWIAPNYATAAAGRVIVSPFTMGRINADEWPDQERHYPVELGWPYLVEDKVTLRLPEGHGDVVLPESVDSPFPQVGSYTLNFRKEDGAVIMERKHALEWPDFPATSYDRLRVWFAAMREADAKAVVIEMP